MVLFHSTSVLQAQGDTLLARPDYQNWLFDPAAAIPGVPAFQQSPAVTLLSGGVWSTGAAGTPSDGGIELVQAIIGQPVAPAAFWYLAPAPLPVQSRFSDERLTVYSAVSEAGRYRNHYLSTSTLENQEHAAYLKPVGGLSVIFSRHAADGSLLQTGESLPASPGEWLMTFPLVASAGQTLRVEGTTPGQVGTSQVALYPVVRACTSLMSESLGVGDRRLPTRAGAVGTGLYYFRDYLLRGAAVGHKMVVYVQPAGFVPWIEARRLSDEGVESFQEGNTLSLVVDGLAGVPRDYLIRVTSRDSGAVGAYRISVARQVEVLGFSPASGAPGTRVRVSGNGFLNDGNPIVTSVRVGGALSNWDEPMKVGEREGFEFEVPPNAVSGPIRVGTCLAQADGVSQDTFLVLSAIGVGDVRHEAGVGFSFGITNAVAGGRNVVEATTSLSPPIAWEPVVTNQVTAPGVWRYLDPAPSSFPQRFFRVRSE